MTDLLSRQANILFRCVMIMAERKSNVLCLLLVFSLSGHSQASEEDFVVVLKNGGKVQGSVMISSQGQNIYAFRGIPYAEPPVGELRFKPPVPKEAWTDEVLDATNEGPVCMQGDFKTKEAKGQEDCLIVNVYTRKVPGADTAEDEKSAVMVFIHGGGFMVGEGSSSTYSPTMLLDVDIVLVTLNYRLGVLGFLSTGDEASPGNYGMLDQTLALKWVQENIEAFGGDAGRVTIFGESAGAGSVSHHVLSPLSKGLFHGVIAMSGGSTCAWAVNLQAPYWSKRLANDSECSSDNSKTLVDCLRGKQGEDIVKLAHSYMKISFFPDPFNPTVDGTFLPDHPLKILQSPNKLNHVPYISGINQREGGFILSHIYSTRPDLSLTSPANLSYIMDNLFGPNKPVKELVKEAYFSSVDATNEDQLRSAMIDMLSDGSLDSCHYETTNLMYKAGLPAYAYMYEHPSNFSFTKFFGGSDEKWGVQHGDELYMLFPMDGPLKNEKHKAMSKKMVKLWTNIAKYGQPTSQDDPSLPKWPRIVADTFPVYHLNDQITVKSHDLANDEKYRLWTSGIRKAATSEQQT